MDVRTQAKLVKQASPVLMRASTALKNQALAAIAHHLAQDMDVLLKANEQDLELALRQGTPDNLIDRMRLDEARLMAIIEGVNQVKRLDDPIGEILPCRTLANGLLIEQMRVPIGVVGMIYEARPNVTVDSAVLCLKSGNAVLLRGSKNIQHSSKALVASMQAALNEVGLPKDLITLVDDTSHEAANTFMRLHHEIDVLIPRGGAKLIQNCVENATIPLLETGTGNCHIYVDESADVEKALAILINAKTQRTSVCNACESLLVHEAIAATFLPKAIEALQKHNVILHVDETIHKRYPEFALATELDYGTEYLALEISITCVPSLAHAIEHINKYSTHHSETIVSNNAEACRQFLAQVDSACVYANASTRFSDGFEFGLGAEIGISTQKLHARGPMGLNALTSLKYIIQGDGQIR